MFIIREQSYSTKIQASFSSKSLEITHDLSWSAEKLSFFTSEYPPILRPTKTKDPEVEMRNALKLVENTLGFTPVVKEHYMLR